MSGIRVEDVTKEFATFQALKGVSLDVNDHEFVVLLGPSGCGKTTLLRIIAGLESATSGKISIGKREVTHLPPRERRLAMVFQNYAVFPHLTVGENIAFGLRMQNVEEGKTKQQVGRAAEMMRITPLLDRYPAQLSGGQRQRVAVARALAVEPEVLLMDEPLSNLDALLRLAMRAELKGLLAESRTTTIYVTHDQVEAMSLADRIAILQAGKIAQYDVPMRIYQDPANTYVGGFIGNPPMNFLKVPVKDSASGRVAAIGALSLPVPAVKENEILLGVRPEDLEIAEPGAGFEAQVHVVEHLGPNTQITLRYQDQMLRFNGPPDLEVQYGQSLTLKPISARTRWLEATTGDAIRGGHAA